MKQLILGGVRSGKSILAEKLAVKSDKPVTYIATAQNSDPDMQRRIATHQLRRPNEWGLLEIPVELSQALDQAAEWDSYILVDCLTVWLNNLYFQIEPPDNSQPIQSQEDIDIYVAEKCIELVDNIELLNCDIVLVSSEVGMGIIPNNKLAREYSDRLGELNQSVASLCERVIFCVAGIPQIIKGSPLDE